MSVPSQPHPAGNGRAKFLAACLAVLALGCLHDSARAQTSIRNEATIATPDGVTEANPANNISDALVVVDVPLPDYGACTGDMYLSHQVGGGLDLVRLDTSTNPIGYDYIGSAETPYDAIAFHPQDFYIYGITVSTNELVRVGSNGRADRLGRVSGLPAPTGGSYNAGEIGPDGAYYVKLSGATSVLYRIDVRTRTATPVALNASPSVHDLAWYDGALYGVTDSGRLVSIDPQAGSVTDIGQAIPSGTFGAMYGATNGVYGKTTNGLYQVDVATGVATLIAGSPASGSQSDGARCVASAMDLPADLSVTKDDGTDTYIRGSDVVYSMVVRNAGPFGVVGARVNDPLPAGITTASWTCGSATGGGVCGVASGSGAIQNVPVDLPVGASVTFTLTMGLPADFTGELTNTVTVDSPEGSSDPDPSNNSDSDTDTAAVIRVNKAVSPASGTAVDIGDELEYTLSVEVEDAATTADEVLTDTLGEGLVPGTMPAGCSASGQVITCTLPAGAAVGTHTFVYTATVGEDAGNVVRNSVVPSSGVCGTCTTTNPLASALTVNKSVDPASGTAVAVGSTLTYTLSVAVGSAPTTADVVLTDTLGDGLSVGTVPDGCSAAGQVITCTLPAGASEGTHAFVYTATVDDDAVTEVGNSVTTSSGVCLTCSTSNPLAPRISVSKSADPASGETVEANQLVTYTLTVLIANAPSSEALTLADALGGAQSLVADSIRTPAGGSCEPVDAGLRCTLAAGAGPGAYEFVYQARVDADASGTISNRVEPQGGGEDEIVCGDCSTEHPVARPVVDVLKRADPVAGTELYVGDTLQYTLTVSVSQASTTSEVVLEDTPSAGLTLGELPAGCETGDGRLRCTLPAGSPPGSYAFTYVATINPDAGETVSNAVVARGGGGADEPSCLECELEHKVVEVPQLRLIKGVAVREAAVGDLVRYTLSVENVGATNVRRASLVDTPPAGFTYVDGSLSVVDDDNAAVAAGYNPIRFEGIDVDAGETATLTYLMRVGAGVRPGIQRNQAQAQNESGRPISNVATAEVTVLADPLVDDSLIVGTVFNDRDGDGWQDDAAMTGVLVQGGFDPSAYVPGSTTIDRGEGPQPLPDASAPLLRGVEVGAIGSRQSEADPAQRREVVISQRLTRLDFTDDFVLTTEQGATLRMDAAGRTTVSAEGDAARGLNAAVPAVERRVARGEGGYVVDYVIRNEGIDERGIPGVRVASVDGLLVETDQFGRYHLAGIPGGAWERGRNFILKVDPSTLPPGTEITTDNPLVRRITPGVPVRFDFGAKLPEELIEGGERKVELELGEVLFGPGSAELRERYRPVIEQVAAKISGYGGGEVVIEANGDSQVLAFDRAAVVKQTLLQQLAPEVAEALVVSVRTDVSDPASLLAGIDEGGPRLGTVLFDTDRDTVRPEFEPLLDRIAAYLEQAGGGTVLIVGHADRRASDAYNLALGMRRAKSVYRALAERLAPELRTSLRVEPIERPAPAAGDGQ